MGIISLKHPCKKRRVDAGVMEKVMKYIGKGAHGAQWASSMVPHSWTVSGSNPLSV